MAHPQIGRALRLMNMEKNGTPTVAEFQALLTDQGRLDACVELMQRPGAEGQITGYPNLLAALISTDPAMSLALSNASDMAAVAQRPFAMLAFINDQSALDTIFSQPDVRAAFLASTALGAASVPTMTSNTAPVGIASASSVYSATYPAYAAFDKNTSTYWGTPTTDITNQWLQYQFHKEVFITSAEILTYAPPSSPKNCRIEYSNDGVSFAAATTTLTLAAGENNSIEMKSAGFYKYWRLFIENTYGAQAIVREMNFKGFFAP